MSQTLFEPMIGQLQRVLDLRVAQHGMSASNLANANTPNYKARSVDFSRSLSDAMERPGAGLSMERTAAGHIGGRRGEETAMEILEAEAPPWSADGNSVNAEEESARMMENTLAFKALSKMLKKEFEHLSTAVG